MLARGWIVPVGGATPDRLKSTGTRPDRLGRLKDQRKDQRKN